MLRHVLLVVVVAVLEPLACGGSRPHARTGPPGYVQGAPGAVPSPEPLAPRDAPGGDAARDAPGASMAVVHREPGGPDPSPDEFRPDEGVERSEKAPPEAEAAGRRAPASRARATAPPRQRVGERIARRATELVGVASLRSVSRDVPDDCTGLVRLAYDSADIDLMEGPGRSGENGVTHIYRAARRQGALHRGKPRPGDLVFFRETYDRDRDGRRDDGLTHVGVVERVESGGLVTFIHRGGKGVARARMHLRWPATHRERNGREVLNDYLRRASRRHRAYLTGELFAGFASPERLATPPAVSPSR